jgi:2-polyprenyl-3-methyl-5-hydroxy-6-metoxy-1,4-benzoquinol methylase
MKHLQKIREYELGRVLFEIQSRMQKGSKILEIGAGTGWQAKKLAEHGFSVEAIDIEKSNYLEHRIWPVLDYDGRNIPFPGHYFDVVFSSNVLEHIPHQEDFQREIKRVLKADGIAVHVLPSGSWRLWTNVTHYLFILKTLLKKILSLIPITIGSHQKDGAVPKNPAVVKRVRRKAFIKQAFFPSRHGEVGNFISEIYWFCRFRWNKFFKHSGWKTIKYFHNNLFYTGYSVLDSILSIRCRKLLSCVLGSSCHIYILKRSTLKLK